MKNKEEMYISGNKNQFVISEDKEFIIRYTSPSFIYYEEQKEAADSYYTHERRLNYLFKIMMDENYSPEEKNDMAHCIMCVKWQPINNALRYCCNCQYNWQYKMKENKHKGV